MKTASSLPVLALGLMLSGGAWAQDGNPGQSTGSDTNKSETQNIRGNPVQELDESQAQNQSHSRDAGDEVARTGGDAAKWDMDADGAITYEEWQAGTGEQGIFGKLDQNQDGYVDQDEFDQSGLNQDQEQVADTNGDGMLDQEEATRGLYNAYDADNNDRIEEPEIDDLNDDMGDAGFWDI